MITLEGVSKRYVLGEGRGGLRAALGQLPRVIARRGRAADPSREFWALRDVSFHVAPGEAVGIVGHNGAGKTTILKLLSGITRPTTGRLAVDGRVAALIELGAGFHPDLTGVENVYLYGAILGLSRAALDRQLGHIADFAELGTFMDTPVKRYSSGMYARLAFAVAAHVNPDVLLVDEVLSVGDAAFQNKCLDFIYRFVHSGKTSIFISHNVQSVEQLCNRLVWLDHGQVRMCGEPGAVLEQYLDERESQGLVPDGSEEGETVRNKLTIPRVTLERSDGSKANVVAAGEDLVVRIEYEARQRFDEPKFCVWVSDTPAPNPLFTANMTVDGNWPRAIEGHGVVTCRFRELPLRPRRYYVWVEVWGQDGAELLFRWQCIGTFQVEDPMLMQAIAGRTGAVSFVKAHGPFAVAYEWQHVACKSAPGSHLPGGAHHLVRGDAIAAALGVAGGADDTQWVGGPDAD